MNLADQYNAENFKITKKGYLRGWSKKEKRQMFEHRIVWIHHNGPVPEGMQIHHEDGNKVNNLICNLKLVDPLTHKRKHQGAKLIDNVWWKPCPKCNVFKPMTEYYDVRTRGHKMSQCKKCCIERAVRDKKRRRKHLSK